MPFSTLLGNLFFIYVGIQYGLATLLFWWLQLTVLDVIAGAYCVIIEEEDPSLILYAVMFRQFYINIIDISKVFATIEEWRGHHMTWGSSNRLLPKGNSDMDLVSILATVILVTTIGTMVVGVAPTPRSSCYATSANPPRNAGMTPWTRKENGAPVF